MEWKGTEVEAFRHEWIVLFDANKQFDPASLRLTDQLVTNQQSTNALQLAPTSQSESCFLNLTTSSHICMRSRMDFFKRS